MANTDRLKMLQPVSLCIHQQLEPSSFKRFILYSERG